MEHALTRRGQHATIVGATSGDTGAAAIDAFRGLANIDVVIFYPHERVSAVQRRQMTTVEGDNIHVVALEGTFDDCQAVVKSLFNHGAFRDEFGLSGVNSINWARVLAQVVYYFTSGGRAGRPPSRKISFSGSHRQFRRCARRRGLPNSMGLPISIGSSSPRTKTTFSPARSRLDVYEVRLASRQTQSPSMDIQVSSNFERLLFDACQAAIPAAIRVQMDGRPTINRGRFRSIAEATLKPPYATDFDATRSTDEAETVRRDRPHLASKAAELSSIRTRRSESMAAAREALAKRSRGHP